MPMAATPLVAFRRAGEQRGVQLQSQSQTRREVEGGCGPVQCEVQCAVCHDTLDHGRLDLGIYCLTLTWDLGVEGDVMISWRLASY